MAKKADDSKTKDDNEEWHEVDWDQKQDDEGCIYPTKKMKKQSTGSIGKKK